MSSSNWGHPGCVNSSNPYHQCTPACIAETNEAVRRKDKKKAGSLSSLNPGSIIGASLSFRKMKFELYRKSQNPNPPVKGSLAKSDERSPRSTLSVDHVIDTQSSGNSSFIKEPSPTESPAETVTTYTFGTLAKHRIERRNSSVMESIDASPSGNYDSDVDDSISVVSDSYVTVGRYNVRPYLSSTLQAILDKYGDIGRYSGLNSTSLRSYHVECVCAVVQELQSTNVNQLTRGKVKEMRAVLKDVESVHIDVSWLLDVLTEMMEVVGMREENKSREKMKVQWDMEIDEARDRIEELGEELTRREEEVRETKRKIEDEKKLLEDLETKSSILWKEMKHAKKKVDAFHMQSLVDELL